MSEQEVHIEISYIRRYITGQYQHKEYSIKLAGSEEQLRQQLEQKQTAVAELVSSLEGVVTLANKASNAGKKVSEIVDESSSEPKSEPVTSAVKEEEKKTPKKKVQDEEDVF